MYCYIKNLKPKDHFTLLVIIKMIMPTIIVSLKLKSLLLLELVGLVVIDVAAGNDENVSDNWAFTMSDHNV